MASDVWIHSGGAWRRISALYMHIGGAWRQVHAIASSGGGGTGPSLAVVASPSSYSNFVNSSQSGAASISFVASASGGAGAYSYSWTRLAVGGIAATSNGLATARLTLGVSWLRNTSKEYSETWQVTATDAVGATATFNVTFYYDIENPN